VLGLELRMHVDIEKEKPRCTEVAFRVLPGSELA
jgi:hypothetical protein